MPTIYQRIEAQGSSILDIITNQVVVGLLDEIDLMETMKDSIYILHSFSAYSQFGDTKGNLTINKNRCDVTVDFILDKAQVPWPVESVGTTPALGVLGTTKGSQTPIFFDKKAGVLMEYHTSPCALDMDFTLRFQNFDQAAKAFDTIKNKYSGGHLGPPFNLVFSFPAGQAMYNYLSSVYSKKDDYVTKSLVDYIKDMQISAMSFDIRKSQLTSPDADKMLMIGCTQLGCVAQLTMDQTEPDAHHVEQLPDGYTLTFKFQIQFGRPSLIAIHTPLSIDNKALPYSFFENNMVTHHHNPAVTGVFSNLMVHEYAKRSYGDYRNSAQILRSPIYDDWFCVDRQYSQYEYRPIYIGHFTLDGPVSTIDLKLLDDLQLHSVVQTIIRETGNDVFTYGGLFNIGVYANDLRMGQELVSIDENLILTVRSDRLDKTYHVMISETTALKKTDPKWDYLLLRYRYFFPMTIERNLKHLIDQKYMYVDYDNAFLNLISSLNQKRQLKPLLENMVVAGEVTNEIFSYTQNSSQLADYLVYTQSKRTQYPHPLWNTELPVNDAVILSHYYEAEGGYYVLKSNDGTILFGADGKLILGYNALPELPLLLEGTSIYGRSLFVAFIEQCLLARVLTINDIPMQYLRYNKSIYPYTNVSGGYYGFNTPIRVFRYDIRPQ